MEFSLMDAIEKAVKEDWFSPDELDMAEKLINSESEINECKSVVHRAVHHAVKELTQQLIADGIDPLPPYQEINTEAGHAAMHMLLVTAFLTGIVTERQNKALLADQLGEA